MAPSYSQRPLRSQTIPSSCSQRPLRSHATPSSCSQRPLQSHATPSSYSQRPLQSHAIPSSCSRRLLRSHTILSSCNRRRLRDQSGHDTCFYRFLWAGAAPAPVNVLFLFYHEIAILRVNVALQFVHTIAKNTVMTARAGSRGAIESRLYQALKQSGRRDSPRRLAAGGVEA